MPTPKVFPLQDELIDAVIAFANADLQSARQAAAFYSGMWTPSSLPSLSECRSIQDEVRSWLRPLDKPAKMMRAVEAMMIYRGKTDGVQLVGALGFSATQDAEPHEPKSRMRYEVTWNWWVRSASLRAVCGLAVASVYQAGLREFVGLCARDGCGIYFVDRKSRGNRRKYCKTDHCELALNAERVSRSRGKRK